VDKGMIMQLMLRFFISDTIPRDIFDINAEFSNVVLVGRQEMFAHQNAESFRCRQAMIVGKNVERVLAGHNTDEVRVVT